MLVSVCVFVREQVCTMSWLRYADTYFLKKERRKEKRNERKNEKRKAPDSSGCARTEF